MVDFADLTLLAADAFAYERPQRDPPSSIRRPGSPSLCSMVEHLTPRPYVLLFRTGRTRLSGTCWPGDQEFESCSLQRGVWCEPGFRGSFAKLRASRLRLMAAAASKR